MPVSLHTQLQREESQQRYARRRQFLRQSIPVATTLVCLVGFLFLWKWNGELEGQVEAREHQLLQQEQTRQKLAELTQEADLLERWGDIFSWLESETPSLSGRLYTCVWHTNNAENGTLKVQSL